MNCALRRIGMATLNIAGNALVLSLKIRFDSMIKVG